MEGPIAYTGSVCRRINSNRATRQGDNKTKVISARAPVSGLGASFLLYGSLSYFLGSELVESGLYDESQCVGCERRAL